MCGFETRLSIYRLCIVVVYNSSASSTLDILKISQDEVATLNEALKIAAK